jgi:hypothetical protein
MHQSALCGTRRWSPLQVLHYERVLRSARALEALLARLAEDLSTQIVVHMNQGSRGRQKLQYNMTTRAPAVVRAVCACSQHRTSHRNLRPTVKATLHVVTRVCEPLETLIVGVHAPASCCACAGEVRLVLEPDADSGQFCRSLMWGIIAAVLGGAVALAALESATGERPVLI